ncbi:MAG: HlyC/CorC family transporter [Polyangiaceae bacterium]|nr:HlyC/CorC family transporter [Polyangiaceae bacterium]
MVINGALAGAEIAVVSVRKTRIDELVAEARGGANALKKLRKEPETFLATVQIGITVVGTTAGAFGGAALAKHLEPVLTSVPWIAERAGTVSLGIVIIILSFLELVVGELVPKSLALRAADSFGLIMSRPLLALSYVARPVVWLLTAASNLVLRIFNDQTTFSEARLSPGEIQQIVDEATEAGSVDPQAGEIASRAIDFADLDAGRVMVPRQKVVGIPSDARPEVIKQIVLEHGRTRMPVYEERIDNVVGYVTIRDLMALLVEQQLFVLEDAVRPAFKVAESMRAVDLLTEMRARRIQLAIVTDDSGAMSGIVTIEDLVEELVGEIASEHEVAEPSPIQREAGGSVVVRGDVPIRDVNRELDLELPEGESFSTIAGLCLELAGRIPKPGQRFETDGGTILEIIAASPRQVKRVRVIPKPTPPEEAS